MAPHTFHRLGDLKANPINSFEAQQLYHSYCQSRYSWKNSATSERRYIPDLQSQQFFSSNNVQQMVKGVTLGNYLSVTDQSTTVTDTPPLVANTTQSPIG